MKAFGSTILMESTIDSATTIAIQEHTPTILEARAIQFKEEVDGRRNLYASILENGDIMEYTLPVINIPSLVVENSVDSDSEEFFYTEMDNTLSRYQIRRTEYEMQAINEEVLIFTSESTDEDKFQRLLAVNESLKNKVKRVFYNTIAKLKEIFAKFMEKLRGNFTTTKHYLDKYKETILKKPFKNDTKYGTQDLVTGIARIEKASVPQLDLGAVDSDLLDDQKVFFERKVKPADGGAEYNNAKGDQAAFWKSYFCMNGHDKEYTGPQFQNEALAKCWDFLYDISKTERVIKKSIKDIDDTITRVMKQAGADYDKPSAEEAQQGGGEAQQDSTKESVVYSHLYQKYLMLENDVLTEVKFTSTATADNSNNDGDNGQSSSYSQRVGTIDKKEGEDAPDNVAAGKKGSRPVIDTRCNNYAVVCSTMLKAKMSACEFIRSEAMAIIRNHVKSYIGQTAVQPENGEDTKKEEAPKQEEPNQEPEKESIRAKAKRVFSRRSKKK